MTQLKPERILSGGCQCGRIRYAVTGAPEEAYLCHCRRCQHATGGVSIAFATFKQAAVVWHADPDWYASSPIAKRPFCSSCGTPLGFRYDEGTDTIDLTIGSFDDMPEFRPRHHFGAEGIHEAWLDTSDLPRFKTTDYDVLVERWKQAAGGMPE